MCYTKLHSILLAEISASSLFDQNIHFLLYLYGISTFWEMLGNWIFFAMNVANFTSKIPSFDNNWPEHDLSYCIFLHENV